MRLTLRHGAAMHGHCSCILAGGFLLLAHLFCSQAVRGMDSVLPADGTVPAMLSENEHLAMNTIRQNRVLSTVSFLAADELAGRDTPSAELNIAAAYVAARFRGAALTGQGSGSKYYQTTEISQVIPAVAGATVSVQDSQLRVLAIMMGTDQEVATSGTLRDVSETQNQLAEERRKSSGPVVLDEGQLPPQALSQPLAALAWWARRVRPLQMQGATVVLVRVADDSPLRELIQQQAGRPVSLPETLKFACPVLLVEKSFPAAGEASVRVPPNQIVSSPVHNVIGILPGSDPQLSEQAVVVTAHLDHIGVRMHGENRVNNGADDNATGVTAVLMLADAFAELQERPQRTVIFMTFWGEEKGLLGSQYFVSKPLWPLERIVANVNIEMIGRPEEGAEGRAWGTGWKHSDLGSLMAVGAARAGVEIFHHERFSEMLYARSDNHSFVKAGVIAHSFSAGSLHTDYHQPTDELERLNIPHMTKVIQGLFAGILPIAQGHVTPKKAAAP